MVSLGLSVRWVWPVNTNVIEALGKIPVCLIGYVQGCGDSLRLPLSSCEAVVEQGRFAAGSVGDGEARIDMSKGEAKNGHGQGGAVGIYNSVSPPS